MPRAARLAAKIKSDKGVAAELVPGDRGSFEVFRDERLVFSKLQSNRFPTSEDEILALLV